VAYSPALMAASHMFCTGWPAARCRQSHNCSFVRSLWTLFAGGCTGPTLGPCTVGVVYHVINDWLSNGAANSKSSPDVAIKALILSFVAPLTTDLFSLSNQIPQPFVANLPHPIKGDCIDGNTCTSFAAVGSQSNGRVPSSIWFIDWLFATAICIPPPVGAIVLLLIHVFFPQ
jgi:hypothetical protein